MLVVLCACLWDLLLGEYPSALHPVVWMGSLISRLEGLFLGKSPGAERVAGIFMALFVPAFSAGLVALALHLSRESAVLQFVLALLFLKASFALRALLEAAEILKGKLGDLDGARHELRSLCSRDASQLSERQLLEAGISSLAENLSDSVVAPLFYFLIAGVPGAIAYRAVNTLDAMIGYKNHYKNLGWASARLDDLLNWIPARISTGILLIAAMILRLPARRGWRVAMQDHGRTPSPNGGWPMAAMAGILGIALRKPGVYDLGGSLAAGQPLHLAQAIRLTQWAGWIGFGLAILGASL